MKGRKEGTVPLGYWLIVYGLSFTPTVLYWILGLPRQEVILAFVGGWMVAAPITVACIYARRVLGLDWPFRLNG